MNTKSELTQDELAQLFNYPSINELFSDGNTNKLNEVKQKLLETRQNLDRIIRYGKREEAESAAQALTAIAITLEFLQNIEKQRFSQ